MTLANGLLRVVLQVKETECVGDRASVHAHTLCDLLVAQAELVDEPPKRLGLLHRVEVLALEVLDDGPLGKLTIIQVPHNGGHSVEPGQLRSPPATLTGNELVTAGRIRPDHNRLHQAVLSNGLSQTCQLVLIDGLSRLIGAGTNRVDPEVRELMVAC